MLPKTKPLGSSVREQQLVYFMFGFVSRLKRQFSSPLSYLLNSTQMERELIKERMRCDRYGHFFSLIVIQFNRVPDISPQTQERELAKFLRNRLRLTDEFGYLLKGGIGVLLPMTTVDGGQVVQADIIKFAKLHGLSIEADIFSYYGKDGQGPLNDGSSDEGPLDSSKTDASGNGVACNISSRMAFQSLEESSVIVVEPRPAIIRADRVTQMSTKSHTAILEYCSRPYPIWKRYVDIIGASVGLVLLIPFLVLAACLIKLASRGPILFSQARCGQFGRPFQIYKFRTMTVDAEETKHLLLELNERDGPAFKIKNDPRVTRVGKLLRTTGLDELPQLINVLKGDMSLVGPRPLPVEEESQCASWQQRRLDTKPGITCLWQISKSRKISFEDWMRMDLKYLRRRSASFDILLMVRTIKAVLLGRVGH